MEKKRVEIRGKELINMLKTIIAEKGLRVEDFIEIASFDDEFYTNSEAIHELKQANIMRIPPDNQCLFIDGNKAKIEKILNKQVDDEEDEMYTYYYKSWNQETQFRLDILEAFRAFSDKTYSEMMSELISLYGMTTNEESWKAIEIARYRKNIKMLEDYSEWLLIRPNLYKSIKASLRVLKQLNILGIENLVSMREQVDGKSLFFASGTHISSKIRMSKTTVVRQINLLSILKLIRKPALDEIPTNLCKESQIQGMKNGFNTTINYFIIENLDNEVLDRAEMIAKEMKEKNIDMNQMTMKKLEEIMGKSVSESVYGNNAHNTKLSMESRKRDLRKSINNTKELKRAKLMLQEMPMREKIVGNKL